MAMDYTFIAASLQTQWKLWNIRGFMILSLFVQLVLALAAPFRQQKSNRLVIFIVWSAYLLADWAAMFVFGLISNAGCRNSENDDAQVPPDVLAFWAAFLLVHLGGPDAITAFSMEDNALWTRHLVGLIAQLSVFMYILAKTLPDNRFLVPTALIFVAGVISYGERTRALYLASLENLKMAIKKDRVSEQIEGPDIFHNILKGLVVDIKPDLQECNKSRAAILRDPPSLILSRISSEQSLLYELLYTKIKAANSTWGKIARAIALYSTMVAFILFRIGNKQQFHGGDLIITYALFAGAFVLHVANTMTLIASSFPRYSLKDIILLALAQGIFPPLVIIALRIITSRLAPGSAVGLIFHREWSSKMAYFNVLSHCFNQNNLREGWWLGYIWNKLAGEIHVAQEDNDFSLWRSVCGEIQENAREAIDEERMKELYEARGDQALKTIGCDQLMPYIKGFQYENTLLIWHIATEICFNMEPGEEICINEEAGVDLMDNNIERKLKRIYSKKLSDYMMYLLVRRPKLMSAVAGISHIRYEDTCAELKLVGRELEDSTMCEFCMLILRKHANVNKPGIEENNHAIVIEPNIIQENNQAEISEPTIIENNQANIRPAVEWNNHGFSVLKDSRGLVELLRNYNNRWEVIYMVWVELSSYAASHCRADSHARQLSEGSEYITSLWVLISLCGIGEQFPVGLRAAGWPVMRKLISRGKDQ